MLWVSLAGPAANLGLAVVMAVIFRLLPDGYISTPMYFIKTIVQLGITINIGLAVFNLIPIPPLDGSGIAAGLMSPALAARYERLNPFGFVILLILIFTGAVDIIVFPVIRFLAQLLLGGF